MAIINVNGPEGNFVLKPSIEVRGKERNIIHDTIPGSERKVHLHGVNIEEKSVAIMIDNLVSQQDPSTEKKEMLAIEITEKPLINLLWLGTFIMIAGLVVSLRNRALENRNV